MNDNKVALKASWDQFINAIRGEIGPILTLLAIVGVIIVIAAILKWAWDRRRGQGGFGGQANNGIWGAMIVGAVFSAPILIIPILLGFFDLIINGAISVFQTAERNA